MVGKLLVVTGSRMVKVWFGVLVINTLLYGTANATWLGGEGLNGKPVVLVHGFQLSDLSNPPNQDRYLNRCPVSYEFRRIASYCVGWPSHLTFKELKPILAKHVSMMKRQFGNQDVVFITHSSGDLIKEYILKYQKSWLISQGQSPLRIAMSIDFAGVSGGTELANYVVYFNYRWLTKLVFGHVNNGLGFLTELTTNRARALTNSSSKYSSIPRLRVVSTGKKNWYTHYLIRAGLIVGDADDLVPLHSQCGSRASLRTSSCSQAIAMTGETGYQSGGMHSTHRRNNFYPWLGSQTATHNSLFSDRKLLANELVKFGQIPRYDSLSEHEKVTGYWFWRKEYRFISNTANTSMTKILARLH